ncbi:hypothetical protein HDV01_007084 [Terramyces sp. JEL0728]|nr:hypothetical protein HDV01_007084 [Terramyces sp. JEL0728]
MYKVLLVLTTVLGQLCSVSDADKVSCNAKNQKSCLAQGCCYSTDGNGPNCFQPLSANVFSSILNVIPTEAAKTTAAVKTSASKPTATSSTVQPATTTNPVTSVAATSFATSTAAATSSAETGISSGVTIGLIVIGAVIFLGAISLIYSKYAGRSIDTSALSIKPMSLLRKQPKVDPSNVIAVPSFGAKARSEATVPQTTVNIEPIEEINNRGSIAQTPKEMYDGYPNLEDQIHQEAYANPAGQSYPEQTYTPETYPEQTYTPETYPEETYTPETYPAPYYPPTASVYQSPAYHPSGYIYDPNSNAFMDAQMGYGGFSGPQSVYIPPTSTDPYAHRMSYMPPAADPRASYMPPIDPRMSYMPPVDPRMPYMPPTESTGGSEVSGFSNRNRNSFHPNFNQ